MSQDAGESRAVVTAYLEGMIYSDAARLARCFHARSTAFGRYRGRLESDLRDQFIRS